jgi:hypothetical protein
VLLVERGDLDEVAQILRTRADAGDEYAARELADLLAQRGDLDGLRARVDVGDQDATRELSGLLIKQAVKKQSGCAGSA